MHLIAKLIISSIFLQWQLPTGLSSYTTISTYSTIYLERKEEIKRSKIQEKGWQPTRLTLNYAYSTFNCCMAKEKEPDTQDDIWTTRIKGPSGQINTFFYSKYFVFFIGRFLTLKHLKSERKSLLNIFCSKIIGRFRLFP